MTSPLIGFVHNRDSDPTILLLKVLPCNTFRLFSGDFSG
jgi:hypothetical protein